MADQVPVEDCRRHGIPSYTDEAGTVHVATGGRCAGPDATYSVLGELKGADDPERDHRRRVYRERERNRAARALDRYLELLTGFEGPMPNAALVASERFVEAVGDYVVSRLNQLGGDQVMPARPTPADTLWFGPPDHPGRGGLPLASEVSPTAHKSNYGATPEECWDPAAHAGKHQPDPCTIRPNYGAPRNVHCSNCGDTRGGPIGHETSECTWDSRLIDTEDATVLPSSLHQDNGGK